jgi:DNA-binding IclR family transcriptional regulator
VAALQSPHGLRTIVPLGASLPLGIGSAGRLLADDGSAAGGGREWVASVGEREAGVASVSAPVRDASGHVIAAVSVSGPIERTTRQPGRRYGAAVVAAARRVEREAGLRQE